MRSLSRWLFLLSCTLCVLSATTIFDLKDDWINSSNPHGPWSFREGNDVLPFATSWIPGSFAGAQPAFVLAASGVGHVPTWLKSSVIPNFANTDFQIGDVLVHSAAPGLGTANVTWTSPVAGFADVSGALWMARNIGRSNHFNLFLNSTLLTQGDLFDGDVFDRVHPLAFSLNDLAVRVGDVLRLEVARTSAAGDFTGVNLTVDVSAVPEPSLGVMAVSGLVAFLGLARYRKRLRLTIR